MSSFLDHDIIRWMASDDMGSAEKLLFGIAFLAVTILVLQSGNDANNRTIDNEKRSSKKESSGSKEGS